MAQPRTPPAHSAVQRLEQSGQGGPRSGAQDTSSLRVRWLHMWVCAQEVPGVGGDSGGTERALWGGLGHTTWRRG